MTLSVSLFCFNSKRRGEETRIRCPRGGLEVWMRRHQGEPWFLGAFLDMARVQEEISPENICQSYFFGLPFEWEIRKPPKTHKRKKSA